MLIAVGLVSAIVMLASPAFATPNITASSGTSAVAPFVTPITSTTSQWTGRSTNFTLTIPAISSTTTCRTAVMSSYIPTTHTQERVTSLVFGDGTAGNCPVTLAGMNGTVDGNQIVCPATSANPWFLHYNQIVRMSAVGTLNATSECRYTFTVTGASCIIAIDAGQSIPVVDTWPSRSLTVSGNVRVTIRNRINCLLAMTTIGTIAVTYTYRLGTARDTISFTTAS
jgi:hypothetical protein